MMMRTIITAALLLLVGASASAQEAQAPVEAKAKAKPTVAQKSAAAEQDEAAAESAVGLGNGIAKPGKRGYKFVLQTQYQQLPITDEDPLNDMSILYSLLVSAKLPLKGLTVQALTGLSERFVAQPDESGFRLQDTALSSSYSHSVQLPKGKLGFAHRLRLWVPTSRTSLNQSLNLAPDLRTAVRYTPIDSLSVGLNISGQYRWYTYAEQAGQFGGMNTQWVAGTSVVLGYRMLKSKRFGVLSSNLSGGTQWRRSYASRSTFDSEQSDAANWYQSYGWSAGLGYAPVQWASLGVTIEHGGPLRRNGIINPFFFNRDETQLGVALSLQY